MGVAIHYILSQKKSFIKDALDRVQNVAEGMKHSHKDISIEVTRKKDRELYISVGNCETLSFNFQGADYWRSEATRGFSYEYEILNERKFFGADENELWASGFCKTQFAYKVEEHKIVADLLRVVAGYCIFAEVNDEGDYYYTGELEKARDAIIENGALIDSIGKKLKVAFKGSDIIKGGETNIK